ncbi:hypothetical protein [Nocardioides alcanivorans]|uniref:hypothetical protein n=1 Tax=Nocardioides alcanivorans TaxID=2897352 RepID=UPI001F174A54|nr:hypothetical protein [Nocardioides alcanivorans]
MGLDQVPRDMRWSEAFRLIKILRADPSSALASAMAGWEYPISREALLLADQFDLLHQVNADPKQGKPKPHPMRPWKQGRKTEERGKKIAVTQEQVVAALRRAGHTAPLPAGAEGMFS